METMSKNKTKIILERTFSYINDKIKTHKKQLDDYGIVRKLNIISLSDDVPSKSYMNNKITEAKTYEVPAFIHRPDNRTELISLLIRLSEDENNRIIIQKPYDEEKWGTTKELLSMIPKYMDVDGFNFSILDLQYMKTFEDFMDNPIFSPTAKGVLAIMNNCFEIEDSFIGKNVTVYGKGLTSGLPIALAVEQLGATVTWCNSKTNPYFRDRLLNNNADFIISCTGVPNLINIDNVSNVNKAHYINVGMSKGEDGKLKADIDSNELNLLNNTVFANKLFGTTGKLTTMNLILNTVL